MRNLGKKSVVLAAAALSLIFLISWSIQLYQGKWRYTGPSPYALSGSEEEKIIVLRKRLQRIAEQKPDLQLVAAIYQSRPVKPLAMQDFFVRYDISPFPQGQGVVHLRYLDGGAGGIRIESNDWSEMWRLAIEELTVYKSYPAILEKYAPPDVDNVLVEMISVQGTAKRLLDAWDDSDFIRAMSILGRPGEVLPYALPLYSDVSL